MTVITEHRLQIERVIKTFQTYSLAEFTDKDGGLCTAWNDSGKKVISVNTSSILEIERASALTIAIHMAIEWLTEKL